MPRLARGMLLHLGTLDRRAARRSWVRKTIQVGFFEMQFPNQELMDPAVGKDPIQLVDAFLLDFLADRVADVYSRYAALRRTGSVVRDPSGFILVTQHREIAQIIGNPAFALVGSQVFPVAEAAIRARLEKSGFLDLLMFRNGARHRQARRSLSMFFGFDRIGRIRAAIEAKTAELCQRLDGETFDFVQTVASTLPVTMLTEMIGIEDHEILSLIDRSRMTAGLLASAPMDAQTLSASIVEFESLVELLHKRLSNPARGDGKPHPLGEPLQSSAPDEQQAIVADLLVLLVTGYDTSRAMLGNSIAALVTDREACARLAVDPALAPRVAEELIRYDTPGQIVFRHAVEDTAIGEYRIGRGEMLALLIGSANRDEAVFDQADKLDFARGRGRPLSFGAGPHACIGAAMARIQLSALLSVFADRLCHLAVDGRAPRATQHGLMRGHEHLVLRTAALVA